VSTILLVDDDLELLELYTDVLEIMGHQVLHAHDGLEALDVAHRQQPSLIVTDWMMPRMDGVELCQSVLEDPALHAIPLILHSTMRAPRLPGIRHVLSKSCSLEEFEEAVTEALESVEPLENGPGPVAGEHASEPVSDSTSDAMRAAAGTW
jgi:CheY-like chemotaxis protein